MEQSTAVEEEESDPDECMSAEAETDVMGMERRA